MKRFYQRYPLFLFFSLALLAGLALELTAQKTVFHNTRVGINTNNPIYALQIFQPDISRAAIDITYASGAGNTIAMQIHNGTGATNLIFGVGGDGWFSGSVKYGGDYSGALATLHVTNSNAGPLVQVDSIHKQNIFQILTNGNVGIGTNGPVARLHVVKAAAAAIGFRLDDTNFTPRLQIDTLPGFSSYVAIWGGNVTPTLNNFVMATDGNTDLSLNVPNSGGSIKFNVANVTQWALSSANFGPVATLAEDIGTSSLLVKTQYVGWLSKINENILTNTVTAAATLYVDLGTNGVQFLNLAGDSTIHTTNRTGSAGFRGTVLFVKAPATNCVLTLNTNWITFGTNNTVTALANKWMVFTFGVKGTAEADVLCSYDSQKN